MDEIEDFFNFTKEFKRETMPQGAVSGNIMASVSKTQSSKPTKREFHDSKYAKSIVDEEKRKMEKLETSEFHGNTSQLGHTMDDLEGLSDDEDVEATRNKIYQIDDGVYSRFQFDMNRDDNLPIFDARENILKTIKKNPVVVLEGDTGCGKTTQVPQYILDDAYRKNVYCKICVTQPRRIAAISIAAHVSKERKWPIGSIVGYKVGLRQCSSEDTRIMYCTTGILLQQLINEKNMNQYTHIILDEVHERDQDMDFLLIVVRRMLTTVSKHVKIILMSATINTEEFAEYFRICGNPSPILSVDTRRLYTVKEFYLENLTRINKGNVTVKFEEPTICTEMYQLALKLIMVIDNIEMGESQNNPYGSDVNASILIFLPGINEINEIAKLLDNISDHDALRDVKLYPIRLHSMISPDEQCKVFGRVADGYRKIILATNIAESSITVPDVKYVIDFCLTKSLITDSSTNFTSLVLHWASRSNCQQRSGRAGRVMNGRVYRLVTKHFYDNFLSDFGVPEILRCPLDKVALKAKLLDMGSPPDILGLAMNPPNLTDIENTILTLKELNALFKTVRGTYSKYDGDLSYVGRIMAALPLDIRLSRLIIFGYIFCTLEEAIIIAAGLSVRSIFITNSKHRPAEPFIQKLTWADASGSDLFAIYKAYRVWSSMCEQRSFRSEEDESSWAKRYFINLRSIREMHLLVQEITQRLIGLGIRQQNAYQRVHWVDREMSIVLKVVIAGAFYPHYFTHSHLNDLERERGMYHVLGGRDPCNTVYFSNFNTRNIGQLYTSAIKDLFKEVHIPPKDIEVNFQSGSERVLVSFKNNLINDDENPSGLLMVPGHVSKDVYKAVRMRFENMNTSIRVMEPREAIKYAEQQGIGRMIEGVWQSKTIPLKNVELIVIPSVFQKSVRVQITHIENCSKFFARPLTEVVRISDLTSQLNCRELEKCKFINSAMICKDMLLAAPFDGQYHRARVIGPMPGERNSMPFKVYFIDYGNTEIIEFQQLRSFPATFKDVMLDMPPRIFECRLANIQPSTMHTALCRWQDGAMELLQKIADQNVVELHVYSVVSFVANVFIKTSEGGTLNDILIRKDYARVLDENYLSKMDHDFRVRKQVCAGRFIDSDHAKHNDEYVRSMHMDTYVEVEPPPREICTRTLNLRGPFSPVESKIYSIIRIGSWKNVTVERDSVNSVLIDSDPQDIHERLVVAAFITGSYNQSQITARATTLMPNIHGFGALMTMLFCPTMQLKCNKSQTKYVSILAGLGYDERNMKSLFEEHDIIITLDVEITEDDLQMINQLRYCMDTILYTTDSQDKPSADEKTRNGLQAKIKMLLLKLFNKNRHYIEAHTDRTDSMWERLPSASGIGHDPIYGVRSIFPTYRALDLFDENHDTLKALTNHCKELHHMSQFDVMSKESFCRLCNLTLENIVQLRVHLLSQLHRDREKQIHFEHKSS